MAHVIDTEDINEAKANMDHIYGEPDPRAYFRELRKVGYVIPDLAQPIFRKLTAHLGKRNDDPVHALDLGCSYGVNAALLKHDLSLADLYDRWGSQTLARATPEDIVRDDRRFFDALDTEGEVQVTGLDPSEPAIAFGEDAGLLDHGLALNLEADPLPAQAAAVLRSVDLMMSTGCVGYVTEQTFEQLMPAVTKGRAPWIANFVLRMFPFDRIAETLTKWGYVTEKLPGETFVQRGFVTGDEQAAVLEQLEAIGVDPAGHEANGQLVAEFYLSRPKGEAEVPVAELLAA